MLREKLKDYNVILASGSPRRQEFFKDLNIDFTIELKEVAEVYPKELKGCEITDFLADLKSKAFTNLSEKDLLITSDTIVWLDGKALGKPKNAADAFSMLSALSGKKHEVITSISIKSKYFQKIISDTTIVSFNNITDEEINYYIKNYKPFDKAGAYGIQEWIGLIGINNIEGSYFNVVGLPVHKLYKELMNL
ncbi:MAG: Maf family nucleotide pyrophosphatase [Polaribacter sp.]|uniref:Maf family nucleotide pyrophosphatase n=1 Tax=Polaribacter sp. TaxID=1920175 RepID=UPI00261D561C|nr:Maf family nucleotide pyrophosphatase [Polaribacter sp.]MBT3741081.1 septum formation protein Maf [Polaribacter sp.]MDG1195793.1 Maf family nucleotide pyrophosphatase [Polaribacter sp.]MDG1404447.1 Maf family nucleotide pyrophosphatase [Polaribacter sp.]MDG2436963.1 Maf family nucleotide pyrophosphatase [Polaribacter sp.]